MSHPVQCKCGTIKGEISGTGTHSRLICYCTDCRAFARFLEKTPDILDQQGGTEIVQIAQPRLRFSQGEDQLAAIRLSDKGLIRWYAVCCDTPMGNTLPNAKLSFIGMIHSCLRPEQMDQDFGDKVAPVNTDTALGEPKPKQRGLPGVIARMVWILLSNRVNGAYKKSALFNEAGQPRITPRVLSAGELAGLKGLDNTEPKH